MKGQPAKKSKPSKSKPCKPNPCPKIVALVQGILSQCKDSGCTHPTWTAPKFDPKMFSVSVYWTRHAVGVKVAKSFLSGKSWKGKCKGRGKLSQVVYFGSPTNCIYSNLAIAHEFATCMHIRACLFWRGPLYFCELAFLIQTTHMCTSNIYIYTYTKNIYFSKSKYAQSMHDIYIYIQL